MNNKYVGLKLTDLKAEQLEELAYDNTISPLIKRSVSGETLYLIVKAYHEGLFLDEDDLHIYYQLRIKLGNAHRIGQYTEKKKDKRKHRSKKIGFTV